MRITKEYILDLVVTVRHYHSYKGRNQNIFLGETKLIWWA